MVYRTLKTKYVIVKTVDGESESFEDVNNVSTYKDGDGIIWLTLATYSSENNVDGSTTTEVINFPMSNVSSYRTYTNFSSVKKEENALIKSKIDGDARATIKDDFKGVGLDESKLNKLF